MFGSEVWFGGKASGGLCASGKAGSTVAVDGRIGGCGAP